ncbi:hypothetical protein F7734_32705 [Scytonema sp. UIC 10036]|uniref:hypothetical protein n=1 Tax=Scytonema sp. UIC 10036 TaxID=2304196 RepID=UPI0012DA1308|nr:hypothetical protein [Scytonema sp. UIC 10036]MUG96848.1 hypothetical protein [Scytonema sp. UIC 10036]
MQTVAQPQENSTYQESQPTSKTGQLIVNIRKTPLFRQLIPQEAGIGLPIPLRKEGKVYVILPLFGSIVNRQEKVTYIYPPFSTITLDWSNLQVVEYVNLRFRNPAPELNWEAEAGIFPHPAVSQMTIAQYKEQRQELLTMYDKMFEMLAEGSAFPDEWCRRFSELFHLLLEPTLEAYYRALAPKFCDRFLGISQ